MSKFIYLFVVSLIFFVKSCCYLWLVLYCNIV